MRSQSRPRARLINPKDVYIDIFPPALFFRDDHNRERGKCRHSHRINWVYGPPLPGVLGVTDLNKLQLPFTESTPTKSPTQVFRHPSVRMGNFKATLLITAFAASAGVQGRAAGWNRRQVEPSESLPGIPEPTLPLPPIPTTDVPDPGNPGNPGQAQLYEQCGGIEHDGPTECAEGTCVVINEYYHQCLPDDEGQPPQQPPEQPPREPPEQPQPPQETEVPFPPEFPPSEFPPGFPQPTQAPVPPQLAIVGNRRLDAIGHGATQSLPLDVVLKTAHSASLTGRNLLPLTDRMVTRQLVQQRGYLDISWDSTPEMLLQDDESWLRGTARWGQQQRQHYDAMS
ncbi:hypothetical protein SODALDRAFT_354179 [Sodiomyces alkalinus F11]|uniref:CBM1 domain-containing protein n=1 Tax=Sodiomyces alkalinus (strain CBS 110278 / VKM F-3762 / F11) TaxID=1314773 RepID=A0A3N2Q5N2_SODAK|nr:hypothetical protein SODALDRAFT_354179 [Sodiomyces alkalinus F11]ROT42062.1 hypothetical protein SODALDRAFT_354179 [Sodiomyces alkalinus F11]